MNLNFRGNYLPANYKQLIYLNPWCVLYENSMGNPSIAWLYDKSGILRDKLNQYDNVSKFYIFNDDIYYVNFHGFVYKNTLNLTFLNTRRYSIGYNDNKIYLSTLFNHINLTDNIQINGSILDKLTINHITPRQSTPPYIVQLKSLYNYDPVFIIWALRQACPQLPRVIIRHCLLSCM